MIDFDALGKGPQEDPGGTSGGQSKDFLPVEELRKQENRFDEAQARRFFAHLVVPAIGCVELRLMRAKCERNGYHKTRYIVRDEDFKGSMGGYFDEPNGYVEAASRLKWVSGYVTVNPVGRALLGRAHNRLSKLESMTTDADIAVVSRLFIDIDSRRVSGVSATDEELAHALALMGRILDRYPEIRAAAIWGCSGNGGWILVTLKGPPKDGQIERALKRLAREFNDEWAEVDTKTGNPSRVMPAVGTLKCKGDNLPERPWRMVRMLSPEDHSPGSFDLDGWPGPDDQEPDDSQGRNSVEKSARKLRASKPTDATAGSGRVPRSLASRASAYLDKLEPAISGQKGHDRAFYAACVLVKGFAFSIDEARPILADWNSRCVPPWSCPELEHKLKEADSEPDDRPRGYIRDDDGPPEGGEESDGRPTVEITTQEFAVNSEAVRAIAKDPEVYHRASRLVEIIAGDESEVRSIIRPPNSPRIVPMSKARIREILARDVRFVKRVGDPDAEEMKEKPAHPPDWCVEAVKARGRWPGMQHIAGIVEIPLLKHDGSILTQTGYDAETELFLRPGIPFPEIPDRPTIDDARESAARLLDLICDFPFKDAAHRSAWIAAALTLLARFAIQGSCPLFVFDANHRGVGKSRLADLIAVIATGRSCPRTAYTDDDAELRKRITSIALAGDVLMLLDNINDPFGGSSLDAALTGTTWRDRILGVSEMTAELPLLTTFLATGNNMTFKGDITRRIIYSRLESVEEHPENRSDFKIQGDLVEHTRTNRGRLVADGLTILRAHAVAGRPSCGLTPLGSFEEWSKIVRSAVIWATDHDPHSGIGMVLDSDPEILRRRSLIEAWAEQPGGDVGLTAAEAIRAVNEDRAKAANDRTLCRFESVLMDFGRDGDLPSPRRLGMILNGMRGRNIGGRRFVGEDAGRGSKGWRVEAV